ncbi:TFIIIC subunit 6 family protein [Aspergillus stella-maris]|uniref:TFIIIC subunit 6 family protein n=1 Tax=Aspergillus stella-maris TaxID=1810926 RepID=UPI003CCC9609
MSIIDPALTTFTDDGGSDWEYEYDDTETETFFLNLDLTSQHGLMRAPRRRNDASASISTPATTTNPTSTPSRPDYQDPSIEHQPDNASTERVQVLGLHTPNPIISYQNQIFSGTWADQLGTELFFARPDNTIPVFDDDPETAQANAPATQFTPLKRTDDYDLIAANSVKILGRKANLISSSGPTDQGQASSTTGTTRLVWKPAHQSNQARFLERLQDVKQRRGESDTVRTVFSTARRVNVEDRLPGWVRTEEQLVRIRQLNERAAQGDRGAVAELESIYASLNSQDFGPAEGPSR